MKLQNIKKKYIRSRLNKIEVKTQSQRRCIWLKVRKITAYVLMQSILLPLCISVGVFHILHRLMALLFDIVLIGQSKTTLIAIYDGITYLSP